MANVIPPDYVDDLPVVEPNQPDVVPVIPEPVLVDEDEDPEEEEFEEEEEPQEEDMDIDDEEDENESELTFLYFFTKRRDGHLITHPPPSRLHSDSEPKIALSFHKEDSDGLLSGLMRRDINSLFGRMTSLSRRLCCHEMTHTLVKKKGKAKDEYYGKLILDLGNEVRSSAEERIAAMENLVRKLGNAEERAEFKKLRKEQEEARFSSILLRMQNERIERDLYWTRFQAYEFYREMIRRGFVFEERPNEAIDVPVEDEDSLSFKPRGIMPPKSSPLTQAAIRRMIKESVDAAITAEQTRHANAVNNASGSG
ncbi:hypothetical protein Tco_0853940 [Tanacetum coccineum]